MEKKNMMIKRLTYGTTFVSEEADRWTVKFVFEAACGRLELGNQPLRVADPEIHEILEKENQRQFTGIELIASENFVCRAVMETLAI